MNKFFRIVFFFSIFCSTTNLIAQAKKMPAKKTVQNQLKPAVKKIAVKPARIDSATFINDVTQLKKNAGPRVKISTDFGDIIVRLYNKTPLHRDNFIKLVSEHFYDSLLFHRVINSFMIQGGDPKSKNAQPGEMLGSGDVGYTIPAEFDSSLFHKRGALCAARTNNPEKASSGCQFYIVHGKKISDGELDNIEMYNKLKYSPSQRMIYKMNGGTPNLDMNYTVFGEVESGMEVVDKIAASEKDSYDRPLKEVMMKMEIIKE